MPIDAVLTGVLLLAASIVAQTTSPAPSSTQGTPTITAVSDCHPHGTTQFCMVGETEYRILGPTKTEDMEPRYTDCHPHGSETYCVNSGGDDVQIVLGDEEEPSEEETTTTQDPAGHGEHCHFHAGVEHCVGEEGEESSGSAHCERKDREYNVPLRVGLLFVILATSAIGVYLPIITTRFTRITTDSVPFAMLKQFGTGVILSTAFVHLFTHAVLMFGNECLGELAYEGTTAAVFMAGLFLSFLVDYLAARFLLWRQGKRVAGGTEARTALKGSDEVPAATPNPVATHMDERGAHMHGNLDERLSVLVLEAGIIFHSLLIGLTLVVAGDSFFKTLFIVILFHQMFEGIALGACIAQLSPQKASMRSKLAMAAAFAIITPLGMAIGIGVLDRFNGNDPSTIVAIGTLDALSAGVLAWVGIVEMLARDWLHGSLLNSRFVHTGLSMFALVTGMILMSLLGKWA